MHMGNKIQNDQIVLTSGTMSFDTETPSLRIHDGVTPGGIVFYPDHVIEKMVEEKVENMLLQLSADN